VHKNAFNAFNALNSSRIIKSDCIKSHRTTAHPLTPPHTTAHRNTWARNIRLPFFGYFLFFFLTSFEHLPSLIANRYGGFWLELLIAHSKGWQGPKEHLQLGLFV